MRQSGNFAPTLPWEVIGLIFRQCDMESLKVATLTSKPMRHEADRFLWQRIRFRYDYSTGAFPVLLPSERALHVKDITVVFLGDPPDGSLVTAFHFRQVMERIVNVACNLQSLSIFFTVDRAHPSPPALENFRSGMLEDLTNHPCPKLLALDLQLFGTHSMVLHSDALEVLYRNHPLLERLALDIPLSESRIDQPRASQSFPCLQELEVSDPAQFRVATGCSLRCIKVKLRPFMASIQPMFVAVGTFSQSLTELEIHWPAASFNSSQQGFNELARGAFFTSLPMLKVLSFRYLIFDGYPVKRFDIDSEIEGILSTVLLQTRQLGVQPRLHSLKFAHISVENIERFTQAVFRDAPSNLKHLEVLLPPEWDDSTNEVRLGERHMINKFITEDGYPTLLHTLIPGGTGQSPPISIATRQTILHTLQTA
ncbi:hypothetical protein DL93DRAFT_1412926 [Clavulina sp. PMI_390]|nr:hypothetical protein DL93DRAFT_1412926 [Clavulina sp. PMI_390]